MTTRTSNSIRNIKYAVIGQLLGLIISFISRIVFVNTLSIEYLGLSGLFTNFLSILSLAELGIGTAIVYSMYRPLADKDQIKVKALMRLYKKAYISIGIIIAIIGVLLTPFLNFFIQEIPDINNIEVIYLMFVANSAFSYFFSYKRSLIIADQKRYITTYYRYGFFFLLNLAQIIFLLLTSNFLVYLGLQLLCTILENIFISRKADKLYPFLKEKKIYKIDKSEKATIFRNVKAMMYHKIGTVVVKGTDNILISKFVGLTHVGIYSNYILVISAVNTIFGMVFQSVIASVGNLGATESKEKSQFVFNCTDLLGFWMYAFASICLLVLVNPFIEIWLGLEYLFPMEIVLLIIVNFYLSGRRQSVLTFRDALGLFWFDRYKPIFEALINLIASLALVRYFGIVGIFWGTIISTVTTCFWVEPFVLYKHGFKSSSYKYFSKYVLYTLFAILVGLITWKISTFFKEYGLISFIYKMLICLIIPNVLFVIAFWKSDEFTYLLNIIKHRLKKI